MRRVLLFVLFACLVACNNQPSEQSTPVAPTIPTRTPTPAVPAAESSTPAPTLTEPDTLRLWTGTTVSPYGESDAHRLFDEQLESFRAMHPDLHVDVQVKMLSGPGSIINYLRAGQNIAPSSLPDVILVSAEQLTSLRSENLVAPLTPNDISTDLWYPAAFDLAQQSEDERAFYGVPFAFTHLYHLAWNPTTITDTVPVDWAAFIQMDGAEIAFSAETHAAAALPLHLYRSRNAAPIGTNGVFAPEVGTMNAVFSQLVEGRESDLFVVDPALISTDTQVVEGIINEQVAMGIVSAESMIPLVAANDTLAYDAIPGAGSLAPPVVGGLLWAITTSNPERQALATELIAHLTTTDYLGRWSETATMLPNNTAALATWSLPAYATFLNTQLAGSIGYANFDTPKTRALAEIAATLVATEGQSAQQATTQLFGRLENTR